MFKNITLGQYYPGDSIIHRLDARTKIVIALALIVLAFLIKSFVGFAVMFAFVVLWAVLSRVPITSLLKSIKPLIFIIVFTFILNIFFIQGEKVLFSVWFIVVYEEGLLTAVFMAVRLFLLVWSTTLMTLTTAPLELTVGLERLLAPLKVVKFPVHEMGMMISIALRFIPTLAEEADRIMKAQAARGADFDTGGLIKKAKALVPLLVPLFIGAFRRADDLAVAMEARCYHGGKGRTRLRTTKMSLCDCAAFVLTIGLYCAVIIGGI